MANRLDATWLRQRFQDHHRDVLSAELDEVSYDFESELISSRTIDLKALPIAEQMRVERHLMRGVLSEVIPKQIGFTPTNRFNAWARDAFEFYRMNIGVSEFVQLFSAGLNFNLILEPLVGIDSSTHWLKLKLEEYTDVSLDRIIAPTFSATLIETLLSVAESTISPALIRLANELRLMEKRPARRTRSSLPILEEIELSKSYRDKRGLINFGTVDDRLSLREGTATSKTGPDYRKLVDRALSRLQTSRLLDRMSNTDPILLGLIQEYTETYTLPLDEDVGLTLFAIGQEIDERIMHNQRHADQDEKLDPDALAYILPFMTAHGLYIQGLAVVMQATLDIERVNASFSRLSPNAKPMPMSLLKTLSETESLFTPSTKSALTKLSEAVTGSEAPTQALEAVGVGALRGSIRAMGGYMLEKIYHLPIDAASDAAKDVLKDSIKAALRNPGLQQNIVAFCMANSARLIELAHDLPLYFAWLRPFITLLKGGG